MRIRSAPMERYWSSLKNVGVIAVLQTTIDTLQGQLAIKDKHIEDRNARLSESNAALVAAQQTAQAAQALTTREQYSSSLPPVLIRAREVETSRKNRDGLVGCFVVR